MYLQYRRNNEYYRFFTLLSLQVIDYLLILHRVGILSYDNPLFFLTL